ncbi:MAG: hypothetical protein ACKO8G_03100 [Actinomycetota bacterium]
MPDDDFPTQDPLFALAEELRASRERLTGHRPVERTTPEASPELSDGEPIEVDAADFLGAEALDAGGPTADPDPLDFEPIATGALFEALEGIDFAAVEDADAGNVIGAGTADAEGVVALTASFDDADAGWEPFPETVSTGDAGYVDLPPLAEPLEVHPTVAFGLDVPIEPATASLEPTEPIEVASLGFDEVALSEPTTETVAYAELLGAGDVDPLVEEIELVDLAAAGAPDASRPTEDLERAIADAAREVGWLARRVSDSLDLVTERLEAIERKVAAMDLPGAVPAPISTTPAVAGPGAAPTDVEEWSMALARLVRSDTNALRDEFHRVAEEQGVALAEVHRLSEAGGEAVRTSVEEALIRIESIVLRLGDSFQERVGSAVASIEAAADAMRAEDRRSLLTAIDDRMEALARLVRSDNERLGAQLEAEIGIGKEVLRAAKELQASLAEDVAAALALRSGSYSRPA